MAAESYDLLIFPEIHEGKDLATVKANLQKTLSVDAAKVESWFAADTPTPILNGVSDDVADRYMRAIVKCGAVCEIESNSVATGDGLSLIPKKFRTTDHFICPECEHEQDIPLGEQVEQCPKCGLVMAKWAERQASDKEKDAIRRRLLREQRLKDDRHEEERRKRAELERLRKLEREIMAELGIKPPGRLWLLFERHPFGVASSGLLLAVALTAVIVQYANIYFDDQAAQALAAAPATPDIEALAPTLSAAVQMQKTGNEAVVDDMADMMAAMNAGSDERAEVAAAASQMMKGVGADKFVTLASRQSQGSSLDSLGGIKDLPGVPSFDETAIDAMPGAVVTHGQDDLVAVLGTTRVIPDPGDPGAPGRPVSAISRLDGSALVDLIEGLDRDLEWERFMLGNARRFIDSDRPDRASEIVAKLMNPALRIEGLQMLIEHEAGFGRELRVYLARLQLELDRLPSLDLQARTLLDTGVLLAELGVQGQPAGMIEKADGLRMESDDNGARAAVSARIALAELAIGNRQSATNRFDEAVAEAGRVTDKRERLTTFARLARRFHDARRTTLAQEMLSEAAALASVDLGIGDRARVFAELALTQGYLGDAAGVRLSLSNTGQGPARSQVVVRLAETLIESDRPFEALALMGELPDAVTRASLHFRLASYFLHHAEASAARDQVNRGLRVAGNVPDEAQQAVMRSQFARIEARLGRNDEAARLFRAALAATDRLVPAAADMVAGSIAIDQARALRLSEAAVSLRRIANPVVQEAVESEVLNTDRTVRNYVTL